MKQVMSDKNHKSRLITIAVTIKVLLFCYCCSPPKNQKPNILLIMTDDMGYSDLSCYGGEIGTPNIDGLAENGIRFTQFYNTARCCPSRASLMTGLHPHQTGLGGMTGNSTIYPGYQGEISFECVTIAEALKAAGYSTYMTGKWHLTADRQNRRNWPVQRGFDRYFGTLEGGGNFFTPNELLLGNEQIAVGDDFYYTDQIGRYTQKFIEEHVASGRDNPFFFYVAFTAPHFPLHAPDSSIQKFKGKFNEGWDVLRDQRFRRMLELGIVDDRFKLSQRDPSIPAWQDEEHKEWELRRMEVYAAQMYHMDLAVGRIVAALERTGLKDNTLIMFLSDNGGCAEKITMRWYNFLQRLMGGRYTKDGDSVLVSNTPTVMPGAENTFQSVGKSWANLQNTPFRKYKHYTLQGGIATPLVVHWPEGTKLKNEILNQPGYLPDIMATCLDVSGADYPLKYHEHDILPPEGQSLLPVIRNGDELRERKMFWEHGGNKAVRNGNWKLVFTRGKKQWELFNLKDDPIEQKDLAAEYPEMAEALQRDWEEWAWRTHVYPKKGKEKKPN